MILVKELKVKNGARNRFSQIYINTLVPKFEYKNGKGEIVKTTNRCISW